MRRNYGAWRRSWRRAGSNTSSGLSSRRTFLHAWRRGRAPNRRSPSSLGSSSCASKPIRTKTTYELFMIHLPFYRKCRRIEMNENWHELVLLLLNIQVLLWYHILRHDSLYGIIIKFFCLDFAVVYPSLLSLVLL